MPVVRSWLQDETTWLRWYVDKIGKRSLEIFYDINNYLSIPIGLIGVNRDITVRKRAEEALEDSQEDKSGKKQETIDVGIRLALTANAPVFSFLETMIGNGIVGGNVPRAELYGKKTAKTALRLLKGEHPIECCFYLILACRSYEV